MADGGGLSIAARHLAIGSTAQRTKDEPLVLGPDLSIRERRTSLEQTFQSENERRTLSRPFDQRTKDEPLAHRLLNLSAARALAAAAGEGCGPSLGDAGDLS
jgi:hypothetical protein